MAAQTLTGDDLAAYFGGVSRYDPDADGAVQAARASSRRVCEDLLPDVRARIERVDASLERAAAYSPALRAALWRMKQREE
jgi:hypothetical protein